MVVAVFGSSLTQAGTVEWEKAEGVGGMLADAGLTVITGGYGGVMEAVSKGASDAGGHVIGVTAPPLFPGRPGANRYVSELIEAAGLADRLGTMVARAHGALALPGSIGTATELLLAWNINHIVRRNGGDPLPTVAVGPEWRTVAETLVSQIDAVPNDIHLTPTAEEGVEWLIRRLEARSSRLRRDA